MHGFHQHGAMRGCGEKIGAFFLEFLRAENGRRIAENVARRIPRIGEEVA